MISKAPQNILKINYAIYSSGKDVLIHKIAFITYDKIPHLLVSEQSFSKFAEQFDIHIEPVIWSTETDLNEYDMIIIRTPWDYFLRYKEFSDWLESLTKINVPIWNSLKVISENIHKFYLKDIENNGIPIIPTEFIPKSSLISIHDILDKRNWDKAVIKPAISGGAYKTFVISKNEPCIQEKLDDLLKENDIMIQKFSDEIQTGEWSLLFFNKKYSHSVLKVPKPDDFRVQSEFGGEYLYNEASVKLIEQRESVNFDQEGDDRTGPPRPPVFEIDASSSNFRGRGRGRGGRVGRGDFSRGRGAFGRAGRGEFGFGRGDFEAAREFHQRSLSIAKDLLDRRTMATSLSNLGDVAFALGDRTTSDRMHEEAIVVLNGLGDRKEVAATLHTLGTTAFAHGDANLALDRFSECLRLYAELDDKPEMAASLVEVAKVLLMKRHETSAAQILGAAASVVGDDASGLSATSLGDFDEVAQSVFDSMEPDEFSAACESGERLSIEEILALIELLPPNSSTS